MKLRKICLSCQGKNDCKNSKEDNWKDCRGKSYLKNSIHNKNLFKALNKNSIECN